MPSQPSNLRKDRTPPRRPTAELPQVDHEHRDVSGGWLRPTVFGMVGALVPLVPFLFGSRLLGLAAALALIGLFVTGAITARFTTRQWWYAGGRQLLFGLVSAAVTYGVGHLFGATVG